MTRICGLRPTYCPGERLEFDVMFTPAALENCNAIEVSVIWFTEGKGTEDLNVHFFRRIPAAQLPDRNQEAKLSFQTDLPSGPHSYRGKILNICWAARVRVFLANGEESSLDRSFELKDSSS